jgi:hypothetical protein
MGKTTLYHPVSLMVIRGGLEYCGVTSGRIRQTHVEPMLNQADYNIEIKKIEWYLTPMTSSQIMERIQGCFAADIVVLRIGFTLHALNRKTTQWIDIRCTANAPFDTTEEAEAESESLED